MKKIVCSVAALFALSGAAFAADLPVAQAPAPAPVYAPPRVVEPPCVWCGWYIGVNAGWLGSTRTSVTNTGTDTGAGGLGTVLALGLIPSSISNPYSGFVGGGQAGFDWQIGPVVLGIEADFDGDTARSNTSFSGAPVISTTYTSGLDWLSTVRGRIGVAGTWPILLYGTGGLAVGETRIGNSAICPAAAPPCSTEPSTTHITTNTSTGWTAGAGVEWMYLSHWTFKIEYLYVDLGSHSSTIAYTYGGNTSSLTSTVRDTINVARAGINYKF